jgi:hypothetical protein
MAAADHLAAAAAAAAAAWSLKYQCLLLIYRKID